MPSFEVRLNYGWSYYSRFRFVLGKIRQSPAFYLISTNGGHRLLFKLKELGQDTTIGRPARVGTSHHYLNIYHYRVGTDLISEWKEASHNPLNCFTSLCKIAHVVFLRRKARGKSHFQKTQRWELVFETTILCLGDRDSSRDRLPHLFRASINFFAGVCMWVPF